MRGYPLKTRVAWFVALLGIGVVIGAIGVGADAALTTFEPGTPIVAADVNANFSALADALAEHQLRVDGECPSGSAIRVIGADGGVTCQAVTGEGETLGGVESVSAGPGINVTAADGDAQVSLDVAFADERYPTRSEVDARLAENADSHGRVDAASRVVVDASQTVSAGSIGSSALIVSCPEGYVATGGGAFVSGLINRADVAWLSTRPHPTNPRSWQGEIRWTAPRGEDDHRDVIMYVVCVATL